MAINKRLLKNLALGLGATSVAAGTGLVGHHMGFRSGATHMAKEFHKDVTEMQADAYSQGVSDTIKLTQNAVNNMMSKISEYAFNDEIEKISGMIGGLARTGYGISKNIAEGAWSKLKPSYIGGSYKNLAQSLRDLRSAYKKERDIPGSGLENINSFVENLKKSKMAIGTTAAGVGATSYTVNRVFNRKPQPYDIYE